MKKTFVATAMIIDTATGKMQFNTASADFRAAMQARYTVRCQYADMATQAQDDIQVIKRMIDYTKKQTYYSTDDLAKYEGQIEKIQAGLASAKEELEKAIPAISEPEENLYLAYKTWIEGEEDPRTSNTFCRAFYEWAQINGMRPTHETFEWYAKKIGAGSASNRAIVKNGGTKFTKALSKNAFFRIFFDITLDILVKQNLPRPYVFTCNLAKELARKAAEKAAKNATK